MSVASTVVLLRALEQRNELDTEQGRIAVGWLIVEDHQFLDLLDRRREKPAFGPSAKYSSQPDESTTFMRGRDPVPRWCLFP